jgi:hypothetical protein
MDNGTVPAEVAPPETTEAKPDGGLQYLDWSLPDAELREDERGMLLTLGAAVVARWAVLPRDTQKLLFETAARGDRTAAGLRGHIARFLHDNANPEI